MEANYRFVGPETMETKIFGRLTAWQNWIFQRPNAIGPDGALQPVTAPARGPRSTASEGVSSMTAVDIDAMIPNNVDLAGDRRLQRALESWQPRFLEWWNQWARSPTRIATCYLRTAVSVGQEGWAHFDHVRMPEYRWGIFLADAEPDRRVGFGDHIGEPVWQEVPGEYRSDLRRLDRRPGRHRAGVGRAAAALGTDRAQPLRPAQPVPDQRRGGPAPVGDGLPAPPLLRPRRP